MYSYNKSISSKNDPNNNNNQERNNKQLIIHNPSTVETAASASLNQRLTNIAGDLVLSQAIGDKLAQSQSFGAAGTVAPAGSPFNEARHENNNEERILDFESQLLEDYDVDFQNIRERRLLKLKEAEARRVKYRKEGNGTFESVDEQEFLRISTTAENVVAHFFSPSFDKCKLMDQRLKEISELKIECRFLRINAEKSPFLASKLELRVLPTLIILHRGIVTNKIIGFEGLCSSSISSSISSRDADNFTTESLICLLETMGALKTNAVDFLSTSASVSSSLTEEAN